MARLLLILNIMLCGAYCDTIAYRNFLSQVYKNSKEIIFQEQMTKSLQNEGLAAGQWESPYVEISPSFNRVAGTNRFETQAEILLMLTPQMPWVSGVIKQSYQTKVNKNITITELQKTSSR